MAKDEPIRAPRGTVDLTGDELERHLQVIRAAHEIFGRFGYSEIRTPIFEETRLFSRAVGEATDIVEKEMFTIPRESASYTLRPEGTAPVVRYYVEKGLFSTASFQKLYYAGPMFRYERPQAGRQRQFHQVGVEAIGSANPELDAELIIAQDRFFQALGMEGQKVMLNTIGCEKCRPAYRAKLVEELTPRKAELCENCRRRLERNPLRVLDCKEEGCRKIVRELAPISERVCEECRAHHEAVLAALGAADMPVVEDPYLVRGFDYYTRTVFETVHEALGARSSICGGGRYDGLVEELGGPSVPALGFAVGVEPALIALDALGKAATVSPRTLDVFVVAVKDAARQAAFRLTSELRDAGIGADMDYEGRGLKSQMKKADRSGAELALLLGPKEIEAGSVTARLMGTGEQQTLPIGDAVSWTRARLGPKAWPPEADLRS